MDELDIEDLVRGLQTLTLPNERFRHRDHVRFAHYRLLHDGYPFAVETVCAAIARFARHCGAPEKFHRTLTECWVHLVAAALVDESRAASFLEIESRHPELLDSRLPLRFYSTELLFSDAARRAWIPPDLRTLPSCPAHRGLAA